MAHHTLGPWKIEFDSHGGYDCMTGAWSIDADSAEYRKIAEVDLGNYGLAHVSTPEVEANARLISAAPEMLEALQLLQWAGPYKGHVTCPMCEGTIDSDHKNDCRVAAAIAKALGT